MKTVNAGIKSKEELRQRLESGETGLMLNGYKFVFDEIYIYEGQTPYHLMDYEGSNSPFFEWKRFAEVEKQASWEDEVSPENPVLCWVSSKNAEERELSSYINRITRFGEYYNTEYNIYWEYATPIKPSECWGYEE